MRRITKKTAIWYAFLLWNWIARTGGTKSTWPGWDNYVRIYGLPPYACPLCQLYLSFDCRGCNKLVNWTTDLDRKNSCEADDSIYDEWRVAGGVIESKQLATRLARKFRRIHNSL